MGRPGRPRRGAWAISVRDEQVIYYRDMRGESYGQLARRFGLSRQRIERILAEKAPELRGRRRPN